MKSFVAWLCVFAFVSSLAAQEKGSSNEKRYDPAAISVDPTSIRFEDFTVQDAKRNREIPIRAYLPPKFEAGSNTPVVLFSHGLGGSREGSPFLGRHWAARGYVAVFLQHPGSDETVWRDLPALQRMKALQEAASPVNFLHRANDVPAVLNQLGVWNGDAKHPLGERLELTRVGMSGHSFGAQTTQAVSGQHFDIGGQGFTDRRIAAAIIMSPGVPARGSAEKAFGEVKLPWFLMTGTHDDSPIGSQTPESRRKVFPALPAGDKYELVLDQAEHSVFTERALPGEQRQRNPKHHPAILALSTAFWDAYLRRDAAAKSWLESDAVRSVLEKNDLWQRK